MKKLGLYCLVGLLTLSCSISAPNNSSSLLLQDTFSPSPFTLHSSPNFTDLEKEYKSFSTKALSDAYVSRIFNKFLTESPNPTQVIRQLEFARYLKDVKSDTSYFNSLKTIINADTSSPSIYTKINDTTGVSQKKTSESSTFGAFVDSLNPHPEPPPPANVILVKANATGTPHDGTSWTNAYTSLQDALTASSSGVKNEIWIASGTYKPGSLVTDSFQLKSGVSIYGGFAGVVSECLRTHRNFRTNIVILSGDLNNNGIADTSDINTIVKGTTGATLDGVTVKNSYSGGAGGGIYNNSSSPVISNVIITKNYSYNGGGMRNVSSSPTLNNVIFIENNAYQGSGMFNMTSSPTLNNVFFLNNTVTWAGGGIYNDSSSPVLNNAVFYNNSVIGYGGGAGIYNKTNSSPNLKNVTMYKNTVPSGYFGGGIYNDSGSTPTTRNSIFWSSSLYNGGTNSKLKLSYSVVQNGFSAIINETAGGLIDQNGLPLTSFGVSNGNTSGNPNFKDILDIDGLDDIYGTSDDGLTLVIPSSARNTGSGGSVASDIAGVSRPKGVNYDMGAYEYVE